MYPEPALLEMAGGMGVGLTFGSDALKSARVGENFDAAVELAKRVVSRSIAVLPEANTQSVPFELKPDHFCLQMPAHE